MPVIFVKGLSELEVRELRRLKVELDARTWRELILLLARSNAHTGGEHSRKLAVSELLE